ncbi:MAG: sulfotransferase [Pseudomonadales bacterium]|nr:sulfotransferase [Pseudomonadales bacterium]
MKNFLVVGTQRTGSSALAELVGLHPDITCAWESTNHINWFKKISVSEELFSGNFVNLLPKERQFLAEIHDSGKKALGFRRLFRSSNKWLVHPKYSPALYLDCLEKYLEWLRVTRPDVYVIHIVRADNMAWLKSMRVSSVSGSFFGQSYPENIDTYWNPLTAEKRVLAKHWVTERLSTLKESNPYLKIEYEKFRTNNEDIANSVCEFLGFGSDSISSPKKTAKAKVQSSQSTEESFTNYREISDRLEARGILMDLAEN